MMEGESKIFRIQRSFIFTLLIRPSKQMWEVTLKKGKKKKTPVLVLSTMPSKWVKKCARLYFLLFHTQVLFEDTLRCTKLFPLASV